MGLQADTYRRMKKATGGDWEKHTPSTNSLWMHYLTDLLLTNKRCPCSPDQTRALRDFRYTTPPNRVTQNIVCWCSTFMIAHLSTLATTLMCMQAVHLPVLSLSILHASNKILIPRKIDLNIGYVCCLQTANAAEQMLCGFGDRRILCWRLENSA